MVNKNLLIINSNIYDFLTSTIIISCILQEPFEMEEVYPSSTSTTKLPSFPTFPPLPALPQIPALSQIPTLPPFNRIPKVTATKTLFVEVTKLIFKTVIII